MELSNIIKEMDSLKNQLDNLRPIREDFLNKLNQKIRLEWNYHSNSIEGNTLSMSETKSFILWGITAKGKPFRDYLEMKGHNEALNKLYQLINKEIKITESLIKEFHKIILVEPYSDTNAEINPGEWKTIPNYLYSPTGERIDFESPEDVPSSMNNLINWLNNHISPPKRKKSKYDLHPLLIAAGFHIKFIQIHPFGDGNGRMSRILTNLILMLCGYVPSIVKQEDRNKYYTAINNGSQDNPEDLAIFLGQAVIHSLKLAIKAAKGERIEEADDLDKKLSLLEQKINNTGQEIKKLKSAVTLKEFARGNLIQISSKFMEVHEKFNKFYLSNSVGLAYPASVPEEVWDGENNVIGYSNDIYYNTIITTSINKKNLAEKTKNAITQSSNFLQLDLGDKNNFILLSFVFETFKRTDVTSFDYKIDLKLTFGKTHFFITTQKGVEYSFLYDINLSDEQLDSIIKDDANKHLEYIHNKIENNEE